jgi:hypothetical protein
MWPKIEIGECEGMGENGQVEKRVRVERKEGGRTIVKDLE